MATQEQLNEELSKWKSAYEEQYQATMKFIEMARSSLKREIEMKKVLEILKQDAEMALSGDWDTDGDADCFTAQIKMIDEVLKE